MLLRVGRKTFPVEGYEEASERFDALRMEAVRAMKRPEQAGTVESADGRILATVSPNATVWSARGENMLFDPRVRA